MAHSIDWGGERLELLADRAIAWPRRGTLFIADAHFGKAASFRALGSPAPEGSTARDLARLDVLLDVTGAQRLVVLGDWLHARDGRAPCTMDLLDAWRERRSSLDVLLVRGNHDRGAGDAPAGWRFETVDEREEDGLVFLHEPEERDGKHALCGHLHPAVRLEGGPASMRPACFWVRPRVLVLPAFGGFTGARAVRPTEGDRLFAVGEGAVVEVRTVLTERQRVRD